ncbi:hypothetical protein SAMN04487948_10912 [Halogranum amylolyticum]|uniref:Restriction endonuclease n=1 Tax=Halogranum amylolyticum TaxID=660520 RepID=A0A1H8U0J2_9EURY|nr:hypothetical protein [Halogranum amylolyticum]SEO96168.1 hypothetical protein SAMN04487948_10912 [Halogranum amylolyticum]
MNIDDSDFELLASAKHHTDRLDGVADAGRVVVIDVPNNVFQAAKRQGRKRNSQHNGSGKVDGDSQAAHERGLVAEMAVAWYLGSELDMDLMSSGDDGVDLRVNGLTVDVKSCRPKFADDMLVDTDCIHKRDNPADVFLSTAVDMRYGVVFLVGQCSRETVANQDARKYPKKRINYVVDVDDLQSPTQRLSDPGFNPAPELDVGGQTDGFVAASQLD